MIKAIVIAASLLIATPTLNDVKQPTWHLLMPEEEVKAGDEFTIIIRTEDIAKGWYLYSNDFDYEGGPIKASITFADTEDFSAVGELTALNSTKHYDDVWEAEIAIFEDGNATFTHKLKANKDNPVVKGTLSYQMCNSESGICVLFDYEFDSSLVNE